MQLKLEKYTINFKEDLTWFDIYDFQGLLVKEGKVKEVHTFTGLQLDVFKEVVTYLTTTWIKNIQVDIVDGENISSRTITNSQDILKFISLPENTKQEELTKIVVTGTEIFKKKVK